MKRIIPIVILSFILSGLLISCQKFVFGNIHINYEDSPLTQKKMPKSAADLYKAPIVTDPDLTNPDRDGALAHWATCLVMFKEGHPHGGDKFHGNFIYDKAPWRQEEFVVIHNSSMGPKVEVDRSSTATYQEKIATQDGPNYIRIIGGSSKLWGLCLFFFDKDGQLINDRILEHSNQYQIFFTISDTDSQGQPTSVMDVRYRGEQGSSLTPSEYFMGKNSLEQLSSLTPKIFRYSYRDTWTTDDMADGVRDLFNQKLLPPYQRFQNHGARAPYDQDWVGLKGHLKFDIAEDVDYLPDWPIKLENGSTYRRHSNLLPYFHLCVRVMKCPVGKKVLTPAPTDDEGRPLATNSLVCAPYYAPNPASQWQELIRFNIPIKVYASTYDTDPTNSDPNEPYYFHLGREIGLSPSEAYEASKHLIVHGSGGFGSWFL